jgi:aldose 1-epimerase
MKTRRIALAAALGLQAGRAAAASAPFTAETETDAATGWKILVLRFHDGKATDLEARIAPDAGANLFSLKVGGEELIPPPDKLEDLKQNRTGVPILFPTPNRVRDATFTFAGRKFQFEANNAKNFIHGLVRSRPWQSEAPVAGPRGASAKVWIDWDGEQPEFARFPIRHRLEVTFALERGRLRLAYAVQNQDRVRLPFGFAVHPYFRIPGERKDVTIQVPATEHMEAVDKLPTGNLQPVAGTPFDLRKATSLEKLDLDDVYFGVTPAAPPSFEWRDRGVRVSLGGSREFTHVVVYTPPGKPFFCIENQTSSTDAHNLYEQGLKKQAHLQIVEPGKTARGALDWRLVRTKS